MDFFLSLIIFFALSDKFLKIDNKKCVLYITDEWKQERIAFKVLLTF